jgi:hypothetical protein
MLAFVTAFLMNSHMLVAAGAAFVSWAITSGWYSRAKVALPATVAQMKTDISLVKEAIPQVKPVVVAAAADMKSVAAASKKTS